MHYMSKYGAGIFGEADLVFHKCLLRTVRWEAFIHAFVSTRTHFQKQSFVSSSIVNLMVGVGAARQRWSTRRSRRHLVRIIRGRVESRRGVRACRPGVWGRWSPGPGWHSAPGHGRWCCAWRLGGRCGIRPWGRVGHTRSWVLRSHAWRPRPRRHGAPRPQGPCGGWVWGCTIGPGELREGHIWCGVRPRGAWAWHCGGGVRTPRWGT